MSERVPSTRRRCGDPDEQVQVVVVLVAVDVELAEEWLSGDVPLARGVERVPVVPTGVVADVGIVEVRAGGRARIARRSLPVLAGPRDVVHEGHGGIVEVQVGPIVHRGVAREGDVQQAGLLRRIPNVDSATIARRVLGEDAVLHEACASRTLS